MLKQAWAVSRMCGPVAILVLFGWAAVARAQDGSKAPPGTRSLADTPFQLILPSEHLLGDWYGLRSWLENHGITPALTFVSDALGNPIGGMRKGFRGANNLGLDLRFDLEKLFGLEGGSFELSFSERFGSNLSQEDIGNVFTVQQVYGGQTYRLVDMAYQQRLLDDRLEFRVGRIAAGDDFLVSPYNYVFVQNGFDGNPVGIFFNAPGMTAYPNATWGGLVKGRPTERTYVMGGVYNGDTSIRDNKQHGVDWSMDGPLFAIGEVGYQLNGLPGDQGLLGNYKAGLWYDDSQYLDFNTAARGRSPLPARFSSLPTNPSVRCLSSPPPASSPAAFSRRARPTWPASASFSVTSAKTSETLSGARSSRCPPSECSGMRRRWSGPTACGFWGTRCSSSPICSTSSGRVGRVGFPTHSWSASSPGSTFEQLTGSSLFEKRILP